MLDDAVDQAVLLGLVRPEEAVALHVAVNLLDGASRVMGVDLVDPLARLEDLPRVDLDVARLALEAGRRLVDQDAAVRQREALALCPAGQQQRPHRHRDPAADRRHVRLDEVHRVVHREPGVDRAARRVDVDRDVLVRVRGLEVQQLGDDQVGDHVVDRAAEEDDPLVEQAGVDVELALAASGALDDHGDQRHGMHPTAVAVARPSPATVTRMAVAPALELRALTKRYDDGFLALDAVDLVVPDGEFFGLLGPNGAGKTTMISAVCNLIRTTSGETRVFGHPHDAMEARRLIGLAEQDINLDRFLDVEETLLYHGGYYGRARPHAQRRAREMMDAFDLLAKADVRAPKLSGGMKRRLLLARALMHEPRLVILDEPTAGVDYELRLDLWRYIRRLHAAGTTILLTTHYLEEAEELCEDIALIRGGTIIARDTADGLREAYGAATLADVYVRAIAA